MQKTLILLLTATILSSISFAQNTQGDSFYAFDANWKGTTVDKATYFSRMHKINDTTYKWDTYNMVGPLIKIETFRDLDGSIAHGYFAFFQPNGWIDSCGHFYNGLAEGSWYFFNDTGRIFKEKYYEKGILKRTRDIVKEEEEEKKKDAEKDKAGGTEKEEVKSEFKGGIRAWSKFLEQNLTYPDRALKSNKEGDVVVDFTIDKDGSLIEPEIVRSVEWSLDEEALRIIKKSKNWTPAVKDGKAVKSYKQQPIYFRIQ